MSTILQVKTCTSLNAIVEEYQVPCYVQYFELNHFSTYIVMCVDDIDINVT